MLTMRFETLLGICSTNLRPKGQSFETLQCVFVVKDRPLS